MLGYPRNSNDFAFANSLSFKLYELVKQYASRKPCVLPFLHVSRVLLVLTQSKCSVLVFCNTRKSCTQAAEALLKSYKDAEGSSAARDSLAWPKPIRIEYKTGDKSLSALLEYGIAIHHAGMEMNDRKLVERLFANGKISIVCTSRSCCPDSRVPLLT